MAKKNGSGKGRKLTDAEQLLLRSVLSVHQGEAATAVAQTKQMLKLDKANAGLQKQLGYWRNVESAIRWILSRIGGNYPLDGGEKGEGE